MHKALCGAGTDAGLDLFNAEFLGTFLSIFNCRGVKVCLFSASFQEMMERIGWEPPKVFGNLTQNRGLSLPVRLGRM